MKKVIYFCLTALLFGLASCKTKNNPDVPSGKDTTNVPTVTRVPRKFLLEHFTGERCGYCPGGMSAISDFVKDKTDRYIWVSHHKGFADDEYTISESGKMVSLLGVKGAPYISINRVKRNWGGAASYSYHPGYLPEVTINDDKESDVAVKINRQYNASSRELTITVSGTTADTAATAYHLSVLITENDLIGHQSDYTNTFNGWDAFVHTRVARQFLTQALGDEVTVTDHKYTWTKTITVNSKFNADKCCVVAYVTGTSNRPILNAEQVVMVEGTTGGLEIYPKGVTKAAVDANYPEEGTPKSPLTINKIQGQASDNYYQAYLISNDKVTVSGKSCNPYLQIFLIGQNTLAAGTYPINNSGAKNTIFAGYRDDAKVEIGGSQCLYVYNNQYIYSQWLLVDGQMVIAEDGSFTLNATTLNGSTIEATYTKANGESTLMPKPVKLLHGF